MRLFTLLLPLLLLIFLPPEPPPGISFRFKNQSITLRYPMRRGVSKYLPRGNFSNAKLDTLSNWYDPVSHYVEIIRQDDAIHPTLGVALGFEFDETNGEYPYTPSRAVLQFKNFAWGGVEFSPRDTTNFTGVSNDVSDDLQVEITDFRNDTIFGHFSGLLLSGAGSMAALDSGLFALRVYRVEH